MMKDLFSQLLKIVITYNLSKNGYNVVKICSIWSSKRSNSLSDKKMEENTSISGQMGREII